MLLPHNSRLQNRYLTIRRCGLRSLHHTQSAFHPRSLPCNLRFGIDKLSRPKVGISADTQPQWEGVETEEVPLVCGKVAYVSAVTSG